MHHQYEHISLNRKPRVKNVEHMTV